MSATTAAEAYQAPAVVEVGEFADLTRLGDKGAYVDNQLFGWWDP